MKRYIWLFTEEWDEGCKEHIAAYGRKSENEAQEIREQMERYSPYDYCTTCEFDTEKEYRMALDVRERRYCYVDYYEEE